MDNPLSNQLPDNDNNRFKRNWFDAHLYLEEEGVGEEFLQNLKAFESTNVLFNDIIVITNVADLKPVYISKNIQDLLGYDSKEYLGWGSQAFFKTVAKDQPNFWENLLKWTNQVKVNIPPDETYIKSRFYVGGVSTLHKNGVIKKFLTRFEIITTKDFELPKRVIMYSEDITHFFKGNVNWMLFQNFTDKRVTSKFFKEDEVDNNIITEREKEILLLVADGKSTKDIAKELFISPDTVSQHRKNMLKRTCAKDTSALIHMCKICEVI